MNLSLLLPLAVAAYLPMVFLGLGADFDSFAVADTARTLLDDHRYVPSRYPSYPVHEFASTALFAVGGSVATNLGTVVMSFVTVAFFIELGRHFRVPHLWLLAVILMLSPVYWVNSTATIDYLWATGFLMPSALFLVRARYGVAGILGGLAIGTRLSSILLVAAFVALSPRLDPRTLLRYLLPTALVGGLLYLPTFIEAGSSLDFLTYAEPKTYPGGRLGRFLYKNVYFLGLLGTLALVAVLPLVVKGLRAHIANENQRLVLTAAMAVVAVEALFLAVPLENEYLLPAWPFALLVLGIALAQHRAALAVFGVAVLAFNVIDLKVAERDGPEGATGARTGFWVEEGYNVRNVKRRRACQRDPTLCYRPRPR